MTCGLDDLATATGHLGLLAYHHAFGGGMTDWLAHVVVSSVVHGLIYSFIFRLMHQLTLGQAALLVVWFWRSCSCGAGRAIGADGSG